MAISDPIADMLTRIRNAAKEKFSSVDIPGSKLKTEIARVLQQSGFIKDYKFLEDTKQGDQPTHFAVIFDPKGDSFRNQLYKEYKATREWGHSVYTDVVDLALAAKVRRLGLFHINQDRTDDDVDRMVTACRERIAAAGVQMECFAVGADMTFEV